MHLFLEPEVYRVNPSAFLKFELQLKAAVKKNMTEQ
jgi:hypothetical protein